MTSTRTDAARLYHQLHLEIQHIAADISYEQAMGKCDDCPHRNWGEWSPESYDDLEFGPSIAETCCWDDPEYVEDREKHMNFCRALMVTLKEFAGDEEIAAAQKEVSKHA